jgi:endonuclease/exonuclease/phosphatase family metal-dependent hydrolase
MVFYRWNGSEWSRQSSTTTSESNKLKTLNTVTLNVLFDKWNGKDYKTHIAYPEERHNDTIKKLGEMGADIITLNEVTESFLKKLEESEWVRKDYYLSESTKTKGGLSTIHPFGNLILTKLPPQRTYCISVQNLKRPVVAATFTVNSKMFSVSSIHLSAHDKNADKRKSQLKMVKNFLDRIIGSGIPHLLQGDFNLHSEEESEQLEGLNLTDAWSTLHNLEEEPGYTFDSDLNSLVKEILPLESRRMRLDRVLYSTPTGNNFKVTETKLVFNEHIYPKTEHIKGWFETIATPLWYVAGYTTAKKESYLFNSDHFGIQSTITL